MNRMRFLPRGIACRILQRRELNWARLIFFLILSGNICLVGCSGFTIATSEPKSPPINRGASISVSSSSIAFETVPLGTTKTQNIQLSNTGDSNAIISKAMVTEASFGLGSLDLPLMLAPGQSKAVSVSFAPTVAGALTGSLSLTSNAPNSPLIVALSGVGVSPVPQLSVSPTSISFGEVIMGGTVSQPVILANTGDSDVTISHVGVTGAAFSLSGLAFPFSLAPGQTASFNVAFSPTGGHVGHVFTGSLSVTSNAPSSPFTVALSGAVVAPVLHLSANPPSLSFGNVSVGNSASQMVTLTNSGNSDVAIFQIHVVGGAFSASGLALPVTLSAGETTVFSIVFTPATVGADAGNIKILTTASNSPINISTDGTGSVAVAHSVSLSWDPGTSSDEGFFIYRSTQSGGPYAKRNEAPIFFGTYLDLDVQAGITYFFVVTAVDQQSDESEFSDEVSVTIPSP